MRETTPTTSSSTNSNHVNSASGKEDLSAPPASDAEIEEAVPSQSIAINSSAGNLQISVDTKSKTPMTPPPPPMQPTSSINTSNSPLLDLSYFLAFSPQQPPSTTTVSTGNASSSLPRIDSSELLLDLENAISATANHQSTNHNTQLLSSSNAIENREERVETTKSNDDTTIDNIHADMSSTSNDMILKSTDSSSVNNEIRINSDTSLKPAAESTNGKPRQNLGANIQVSL
jgi:hypothetical protein